jgi:NADH-quinone oxidoreductase subunit L
MNASIPLLLPFFSALLILLGHHHLKGVAVLISVGSSIISFIACLALLAAADDKNNNLLLLPFIDVGHFHANIDILIDKQSRGMMFIVSFIGMLVHIFSLGYMKDDEARPRFFGSLSLFMFSMTGIVLAGNLLMMFIFWELVGLSSYLLIGHWYQKASAAEACKKAFLTNRIGDFGFMIGILLLFGANHGSVNLEDLETAFKPGNPLASADPGFVTAAALCIFLGAVGKSAQFPLHVWLPDAMEGPTPVSALIHAATMVAAGVYMLVRVSFLIEASPLAAEIIAGIGCGTALLAALMATQQNDIKRVLAYSTLSQLGYMVMAVGAVAMAAKNGHEPHAAEPGHPAMFHLYTHAFFKAMLFLGSGAVIYACHHEQDIWKMGGLRKHMPVTFYTFAIGTAALMGVPFLSGFWSKEAVLGVAFDSGCKVLFLMGAATAALTAFYMTRLLIVAFFGKPRTDSAHHATEAPMVMILPLAILAIFSVISGYDILATPLQAMKPPHVEGHQTVLVASLLALIIGVGAAIFLYRGKDKDPVSIKLFANKFYFDEIYAVIVRICQDRLAWIVTALERVFVDGLVARLPAAIVARLGAATRMLQGGHMQGYTFLLGGGVIGVVYLVVFVLPRMGH